MLCIVNIFLYMNVNNRFEKCINLNLFWNFLSYNVMIIVKTYLQSITVRVEEWRLKQRDTEEWMRHRQLPCELRERVRRFIQYKWLATRGVNEESILQALPADLRRDIKRHLCLGLVRRVNAFTCLCQCI
jgi:cyclic nucleotide gated channel